MTCILREKRSDKLKEEDQGKRDQNGPLAKGPALGLCFYFLLDIPDMSRPLRIEFPLAYYHVMNRGLAYQDTFTDPSDYESLLNLLAECQEMWGIQVIAYCLLNNPSP